MDEPRAPTAAEDASALSLESHAESTARLELAEILERHRAWLESGGESGRRADLSRARLEGADLTDANLRGALLDHTVLNAADLLLADLQGASLIQADLQFANLLGTKFRHANLQGATMEGATGLLSSQLAGANLIGTALPTQPPTFEGLKHVAALTRWATWLIVAMAVVNGLAWLRIFTTADVRLVQNAPALPFGGLRAALPLVPFYLFGPIAILGLYVAFHFYLQRLWDVAAALPAIFPDGRRLDAALPWFARWPARKYFRWLEEQNLPFSRLEKALSMFLLYWMVPATVFLFWGRYLTLQDVRGTTLQGFMAVAAVGAALYFPRMVAGAFGADTLQPATPAPRAHRTRPLVRRAAPPLAAALILFLLSTGIILGGPRVARHPWEEQTRGISTWAARVFWLAGYNPYAQLTESEISTKSASWTGRDEEVALVRGASLNNLRLRYAQAYGAFLVKARLWQADLQNAYLSEADLRGANLRQAVLRGAALDRARMGRTILTGADLQKCDATQADLREADLSHASLAGATFIDARLDGASLYAADARNALLQRAALPKTDLREAILAGANFAGGNLEEAYLSSARMYGANLERATLRQAILTQADLRNADFRGADLEGAILNEAELSGATLDGADLRNAQGLDAGQICSAASIAGAQFDDSLQTSIAARCAGHR